MKSEWLKRYGCSKLIVFYNGWGMDHYPFLSLGSSEYDVVSCFDYRNLDGLNEVRKLCEKYEEIVLIAWSMGVQMAALHFAHCADVFSQRIAINGTLAMVDDRFGIPKKIFAKTLDNMDEEGIIRFYRRMCAHDGVRNLFLKNRPQRTVDDQRSELEMLAAKSGEGDGGVDFYSAIIICEKDKIVPSANQVRFWKTKNVIFVKDGHFPFYGWEHWETIVELAGSAKEIA